jgi:hypothetical protein
VNDALKALDVSYLLEKLGLLVGWESIESRLDRSKDFRALETGNLDIRHICESRVERTVRENGPF